jgi:hypothetical protein
MSPGEVTPDQFVAAFEKKFYVSRDAFAEAFRRKSMANLIHLATAAKVDIWVAARNSFSRTCLERRRKVKVQGGGIFVFSPDDLVLAKLLWYKRTRSERQIDDAAGILQVSAATIDSDYLQKMADELGVEEHLETVRRKLEGG